MGKVDEVELNLSEYWNSNKIQLEPILPNEARIKAKKVSLKSLARNFGQK